MPLVLAIEPDHRQSSVLKRVVREHVHADLLLVDSPDAAVAALATQIPDVILISTLLAPQDEEELIEKVRSLDGGGHIQTYTIPQFASTTKDESTEPTGGFFGKFRRKRASTGVISGCDPDLFAQEVATFVAKALELKTQNLNSPAKNVRLGAREVQQGEPVAAAPAAQEADAAEAEASSWSSPFEWRRSDSSGQSKGKKKKGAAVEAAKASSGSVEDLQASIRADEERQAKAAAETAQKAAIEERAGLEAAERARQEAERRRLAEEERKRLEAEVVAKKKREEEERKRLEADAVAKKKREDEERKRLEAEATARKKREEEERKRLEAETAARKRREDEERKRLAEEERRRLEAEAAAKKRREEEERKRLEAEAAAKKKREDEERKRLAEEERRRLEAEATAKKKREEEERKRREDEERKRLEAEAAARKKREEEERKRREEEERRRLEAEERARLEAERLRKEEEERRRLEAEAAAARERAEQERRERLAVAEATARQRREEKARKAAEAKRQRASEGAAPIAPPMPAPAPVVVEETAPAPQTPPAADPYAEFREENDGARGILRLMPLDTWAKTETRRTAAPDGAPDTHSDLQDLIAGLSVPLQVAVVTYPRGCRIRRVRVQTPRQPDLTARQAVIVSRRALQRTRGGPDVSGT